MTNPEYLLVLQKVADAFDRIGIEYYVVGSFASSVFGIARTTLDVDLVARVTPAQAEPLEHLLTGEFYIDHQMILEAITARNSFNLIHLATMLKIDVFLPRDTNFDQEGFLTRTDQALAAVDAGIRLWFAAPEAVLVHKLLWYKEGGGSSDRQWQDIIGIWKVQGERLDQNRLERWARELDVHELLTQSRREAAD